MILEDFRVASVGVAATELPDLEEGVPVDVVHQRLDGHALEYLGTDQVGNYGLVGFIVPVDLHSTTRGSMH